MRYVMLGHGVLDNKDPCRPASRLADIRQDLDALCVVPIMKDHLEAVGVGFGCGLEHVARDVLASLLKPELRRP